MWSYSFHYYICEKIITITTTTTAITRTKTVLFYCCLWWWLWWWWGDGVIVISPVIVPSSSPELLQLEATSRAIFLSWQTLPLFAQNGIITGYSILITDLDKGDTSTERYFVEDALNLTISDLTPYTTYGIVLAANTISPGPSSKLHAIQTSEEG